MIKALFYCLVSCLVIACPKDSKAEPIHGRDFYAAQSQYWNVAATTKYREGINAVGSLHNTFGSSLAPVRSILAAYHPGFYRVHIINAVCIRNGNCGRYEIGYGYSKSSFDAAVKRKDPKILKPFKEQVALYRQLQNEFQGTKFIVSPALEHDLSKEAWRVLADATVTVFPTVQLANSPDGAVSIERYRGSWIERHGSVPQSDADIVSLDGADATQIDIGAFLAHVRKLPNCKVVMLWTAGDNCRVGAWQDPRVRKNCASGKTLELMVHLYDPVPGTVPFTGRQCDRSTYSITVTKPMRQSNGKYRMVPVVKTVRGIAPFKAPDIWKPLAESSVNYDPRSELPVLITKRFGRRAVNALASNGTSVGAVGYYGTYLDQGFRWYSGYAGGSRASGYEFQKGAQANSGSPFIWLEQNGTCSGPLLPGRRSGLMRDH